MANAETEAGMRGRGLCVSAAVGGRLVES